MRIVGFLVLGVAGLSAASIDGTGPSDSRNLNASGLGIREGNSVVVRQAAVRAVALLGREVLAWPKENGCFSCHNNGDAFRALLFAFERKTVADLGAWRETLGWLDRAQDWRRSGKRPEIPETDGRLADIQFGWALAMAVERGVSTNRLALLTVARRLIEDQDRDGGWVVEPSPGPGSPATYGNALATVVAVRILHAAASSEHDAAIRRANRWLGQLPIRNVAAAVSFLLWPDSGNRESHSSRRKEAIGFLLDAQTRSGGWGPYRDAPAEVFDTSLAMLALAEAGAVGEMLQARIKESRDRGFELLVRLQESDGGWPATTRPSGNESYAQRISTTAWAIMALLSEDVSRRSGVPAVRRPGGP